VTELSAPRLRGPIVVSVVLHGGLIAAVLLLRPPAPPPQAPIYRVQLFAAPPGERAVGVVQDRPAPTPPVEKTTPTPPPAKSVPATKAPAPPKVKTRAAPKAATPVAAPEKPEKAPAPVAGGGPTGGKGADVANVHTPGVEFPYQPYIDNITRQVLLRFRPTGATLTATVRFVIKRDGSVDPNSIAVAESSRNWNFDQAALAAVEAAANAKSFGALPGSFNEDILPVQFRFTPSVYR